MRYREESMDRESEERREDKGRQAAYVTEHWAKARYSRSTSRPRFSSLRNSCTHLWGTALPEFQPGRRSCPGWAHRTGMARAPGVPFPQKDTKQPQPQKTQ